MTFKPPPGNGWDQLVARLQDIEQALRTLQRPTGTSVGSLYDQVQAALADIDATVTAAIAANSYTRAQVDSAIASPPGNVAAAGNVSAGGTMTAAGLANFPAGVQSIDARNRVLTSGYAVGYWDSVGRGGTVPSALRYKQDVEPADTTALVEALRTVALVRFRYIQAVEELGDAAPYLLGSIAEYFVAAGLGEWVFYGEDGQPDGINYERLTIPLIAAFQSVDERLRALENPEA